jgi:gluconate 2-dehydrogenase
MLALVRRLREQDVELRQGHWPRRAVGHLRGLTLGIVGLGRIGGAVARRAALGFNMKVLYTNRSANAEAEERYGARRVELDELLATSDFVCLQVPLTPQTRHLIGASELRKMKKSAILINASRGQTVDENALIEALRAGTIHGAGLDVFDREPLDASSPLLTMKNVVALPHIGSATHETRHAMARCAAENLVGALDGTLKINIVNREVLSR